MRIPKISDERLYELYSKIKPVVRYTTEQRKGQLEYEKDDCGEPYYIEDVDLRSQAFTWDPAPAKRAGGLEEIAKIETYHTYAYYGFFKPTIAEVLSQIPEQYIDKVTAFETVGDTAEICGDYHRAITRLYKKKQVVWNGIEFG